ncbi:MAG: hypothetical protein ACQEQS_06255 [Thermodesulfobacteriota bacterium]
MTKYFISPFTDDNNENIYIKTAFTGNNLYAQIVPDSSDEFDEIRKAGAYFCLDCDNIFFRNHQFPFKSRKQIEKVIDFELEPFFPSKDDSYEFVFNQTESGSDKNTSQALCLSTLKSFLDAKENQFREKNIQIKGFAPFSYFQASALLRLGYIKDDAVIIVRENDLSAAVFAVSEKKVLSVKKVSDCRSWENIASAVKILINFTSLSVKNDFHAGSVEVIDESELSEEHINLLKKEFVIPVNLFDKTQLAKFINIDSDLSVSYLLFCRELASDSSIVFRKKKPGLKKFLDLYKKEVLVSSVFALTAIVMLSFQVYNTFSELKSQSVYAENILRQSLEENFPGIKTINASVVDQAKVKVIQAEKNQDKAQNRFSSIKKTELLSQIISGIPQSEAELENITILPEMTSVSGIVSGYDVIDKTKNDLEENSLIDSVSISRASTDNSGEIRFRLELKLNE